MILKHPPALITFPLWLCSHFAPPRKACSALPGYCRVLWQPWALPSWGSGFPWVSLPRSHFPGAAGVYVQSRDHILLAQSNLLGLPASHNHVEGNVFLRPASLQLSVQNTAESWAPGQAYMSLWNTLSHHSLAEHPRRCLFGEEVKRSVVSLLGVSRDRTFRNCLTTCPSPLPISNLFEVPRYPQCQLVLVAKAQEKAVPSQGHPCALQNR